MKNIGFWIAVALLTLGTTVRAETETGDAASFDVWLDAFRTEAITKGVSEATLDAAFEGLTPDPKVIELDNRQPEFTTTYQDYITRRLSETRISRGLAKMAEHADTLRAVSAQYGVQPRFIAAIWGLETNYGSYTGGMSVIRSLATLAFDPRRARYFRGELLNALRIIDAGHVSAATMLGSWAGAMGQSQFMPSSFNAYAQDFDGDGRRDIWTTEADVFASIAHYLKTFGWNADETWGRPVQPPANLAELEDGLKQQSEPKSCRRALRTHTARLPLADWQGHGFRRLNGDDLPAVALQASLVRPAGADGPAYLTYGNYRAILRYNCSNYYALSVSLLAEKLRAGE